MTQGVFWSFWEDICDLSDSEGCGINRVRTEALSFLPVHTTSSIAFLGVLSSRRDIKLRNFKAELVDLVLLVWEFKTGFKVSFDH